VLGTFHASDLIQVFYGILPNYASRSIQDYYFSFVHNLDPNNGTTYMNWPRWSEGEQLMNFHANRASLINDDFRKGSYDYIVENIGALFI
jgi:hypothetical protein